MTAEDLKRQLSLEQESIQLGIQTYRDKLKTTAVADLPTGIVLLKSSIEPLIESLKVFRLPCKTNPSQYRIKTLLDELSVNNSEIAYITLKACFQSLTERTMVLKASIRVADMILDHHEYLKFKQGNPGYLHKLEEDLSSASQKHRRTSVLLKKRKLGISLNHRRVRPNTNRLRLKVVPWT